MDFLKFKKKKDEPIDLPMPTQDMQASPSAPTEQVSMMRQQGYTDNQISQALQSQGYEQSQIYDAMNQVPNYGNSMETGMPTYGEPYRDYPQQPQPQMPSFSPQSSISAPLSFDDERIQEVAEAIIDEKWEDFVKDIKKVIEWKEKSEDRLTRIEQQILDMRMGIDVLTKSILSKVQGYDQNIVDVGTEIKAMEKVFQKVLPSLTENVNKLERMTKGYSEPKGFSDPFMRR